MKQRSPSSTESGSPETELFSRPDIVELPPKSRQELEAEIALYRHALEKSREELQAFAYSVSHDLRAPLRAIEGFSKIVLEDFSKDLCPDAQRFLRHITVNTQLMGSQVDDLLRFYRAGKNPAVKIPLDSNAICIEALASLEVGRSPTASIVHHDLPSVHADPMQLREIFSQLIANALKFSGKRPAPKIEIGARSEPGATTFFVRDNGVGFDDRDSARLFQVFQKLHSASEFPGNGIGLAMVKKLVEGQGGCVSAEGTPDGGATFYFSLPNDGESIGATMDEPAFAADAL